MRRSGYESVGGFDRELVRCEDRDLGIRLENAGLRFALADDARSTHHTDHGDVRTWRRRSAIYGASDQRIGEKHPQRRDVSPWAFLAELAPPVRPLLIAASVSPRAGKLLGGTSYSLARLVDRLGWHRRAVDLAGLCYALDYYGGVGTRSGSGRNAIASFRSWRSPSTPVMP